ncbi:MAG: hypothetical protein K6E88_09660, partial [Lachnospiraceae bacterium]|nr:hypothetical protein [Lachnospiraceae bacterium]
MKFSLRKKTVLLISLLMIVLCTVGTLANSRFISAMISDHYADDSRAIADTVAAVIDAGQVKRLRDQIVGIYNVSDPKVRSDKWGLPEFEDYLSGYAKIEDQPDFIKLRDWLRVFQENSDIDSLYLIWIDPAEKNAVYLCDAANEDACPPGCIDEIYPFNYAVLEDPEQGFMPYET